MARPIAALAALYVAAAGPYFGLADVDPWDESRDARRYPGDAPVVAHPPCQRWGRYATGGPNPRATRRIAGDDGGCFESALRSVRTYGGVLEHPEATLAYAAHGLARPPKGGGWIRADDQGGWCCCVEQGHYGHAARKATWLYACHTARPELIWGKFSGGMRLDMGPQSKEHARTMRAARKVAGLPPMPRLTEKQRIETPTAFRDLLISIARSANR